MAKPSSSKRAKETKDAALARAKAAEDEAENLKRQLAVAQSAAGAASHPGVSSTTPPGKGTPAQRTPAARPSSTQRPSQLSNDDGSVRTVGGFQPPNFALQPLDCGGQIIHFVVELRVPCITHEDGPDMPLLPAALADPGLAYVVVTSPEAAKVFLAGWTKAGEPPVPVACVGKATGDALVAGGVTPVFTPSKATGETLAAEIPLLPPAVGDGGAVVRGASGGATAAAAAAATEAVQGTRLETEGAGGGLPPKGRRRVLYPASAKAQKTLESGLRARGFDVRRLNTYDTVPATWDKSAEAAAVGAVVAAFGSPSAVKTWAARMGVGTGVGGAAGTSVVEERTEEGKRSTEAHSSGGALAACIGETSARACREAGWPASAIFYPEKPGLEGWAKAVGDALAAAKNASLSKKTGVHAG